MGLTQDRLKACRQVGGTTLALLLVMFCSGVLFVLLLVRYWMGWVYYLGEDTGPDSMFWLAHYTLGYFLSFLVALGGIIPLVLRKKGIAYAYMAVLSLHVVDTGVTAVQSIQTQLEYFSDWSLKYLVQDVLHTSLYIAALVFCFIYLWRVGRSKVFFMPEAEYNALLVQAQ